jgi:hypothetical protein
MAPLAISWTEEDLEDHDAAHDEAAVEEERRQWPRVSTLLNLVQAVQDQTASDEEVVAVITHLLHSGRVRLGGIFAGQRR